MLIAYFSGVFRRLAVVSVLATALVLPAVAWADQVTVFAAASMKNAMQTVSDRFNEATGHDLAVSLAGSSALARQIQQGAPADLFISANPGWMDALEKEGLIVPETRVDLLGNVIVLIAHGEADKVDIGPELDLPGMLGENHLAMAMVDAVPAGIYGKAALKSLGLWDAVAPKVAQADNVRAALALVATGEAPLGIVYATDAAATDKISVIGTFPADSHPPIVYPAAAVTGRDNPAVSEFLAFLRTLAARNAFEAQGFIVMAD
ncbi:molybdate ABC transporter substrate-binding protein [Pontibaca salina]|uniref:Molybdate-binding protein ModA n=1 Tax=Pontibaca salina TaxID=2795731 RepID=A0A934HKN0_9RHOB|nr:molybdate ABC transporter substrate-binding protein [Pontibaca salina]MBI6629929.1 molybdate ABC transporter substrate-binding protein [Pontibaca salina]